MTAPGKKLLHPIERMVLDGVRCAKCGTPGIDTCGCWTRCSCGWLHETGGKCRNPDCRPTVVAVTVPPRRRRKRTYARSDEARADKEQSEFLAKQLEATKARFIKRRKYDPELGLDAMLTRFRDEGVGASLLKQWAAEIGLPFERVYDTLGIHGNGVLAARIREQKRRTGVVR